MGEMRIRDHDVGQRLNISQAMGYPMALQQRTRSGIEGGSTW